MIRRDETVLAAPSPKNACTGWVRWSELGLADLGEPLQRLRVVLGQRCEPLGGALVESAGAAMSSTPSTSSARGSGSPRCPWLSHSPAWPRPVSSSIGAPTQNALPFRAGLALAVDDLHDADIHPRPRQPPRQPRELARASPSPSATRALTSHRAAPFPDGLRRIEGPAASPSPP